MNFWKNLQTPFTALAPMEGVTDSVFRQVIALCGKPDVYFTEFVSTSGLLSRGKTKVAEHLGFAKQEMPVIVQLFGEIPDEFFRCAMSVRDMGFAGIDINMGCPANDVVKKGGGAALIKNPKLAGEIIRAVKDGGGLPVSVKTRIGYDTAEIEKWLGFILNQKPDALTVHLRTFRERYTGSAHWDCLTLIKKMRDDISPDTVLIGNGDLRSISDIDKMHQLYGIDGYMIGRGILSNPWAFNRNLQKSDISTLKRLNMYLKHIEIFEKTWGISHNPADLKKYCQAYINTLYDATTFRNRMMHLTTLDQFKKEINNKIKEISAQESDSG